MINKIYRIFHPRVVFVNEAYADFTSFVKVLPVYFKNGEGRVIYKGRNELREFRYKGVDLVVKSFRKPNLINRIVYGLFRPRRSVHMNMQRCCCSPESERLSRWVIILNGPGCCLHVAIMLA